MQVTLYRCGLCNNHDFDRPFKVERHMDEQHSNFGYMCTECRRVFLRRDSKHKNCKIGEEGGKNLTFVCRNNYLFGEEEKEQYSKFKKESRKLVITIDNTCNANTNTDSIIPAKVNVKEKKEQKKEKKKRENKENKSSDTCRAERKRKHCDSPARSVTPVPESRIIVLKPKNRITAPPTNSYVPTLSPPTCIPELISPINSPKPVPHKSPSIATICLDEHTPSYIVTKIATTSTCNRINNVNSTEEKVPRSTTSSVKSINEEETCISLFAADEYVPAANSDDVREEPTYEPTPKHILQLKAMAECQKSRLILNVGGSRFETCVSTLQSDPSSILSYMVLKESPMKPYSVDNIYTYFLDRDPRHFVHILNYLRSTCNADLSTFPRTIIALRELQRECNFYNLSHLHCLLEKRIVDILQGHLQD